MRYGSWFRTSRAAERNDPWRSVAGKLLSWSGFEASSPPPLLPANEFAKAVVAATSELIEARRGRGRGQYAGGDGRRPPAQ